MTEAVTSSLSLKISNDEIGEMREDVRYIYRKKNAWETK